ncbi:unnamed protein product [Cuscuta campestris]|uniref:Uncharacterized protein n=1 Tax=Cuscuta campestris TaxID=132261 RepID=A0A484KBZ5_9ASTE|nr:unnamed protein product [Cuscuta campestris]
MSLSWGSGSTWSAEPSREDERSAEPGRKDEQSAEPAGRTSGVQSRAGRTSGAQGWAETSKPDPLEIYADVSPRLVWGYSPSEAPHSPGSMAPSSGARESRKHRAEHGLVLGSQGSVPQGGQAEQPGSPSIEEIAAVEVPGETKPRLQKRTLLVDSLIRECNCDLSSDEFLKAMRYAGPLVTVRRPTPEESVFDAPPGYFAIHLKSLESGFRFPLESLVTDFFKYFDFLPCQLVPNSHRYLAGFLIRCREMGVWADLERLLTLFRVAKSSGSDGGSFAALCQRQERLFRTKKESNRTWKSKFVFVSVGAASPFRDTPLSSFRRRSKPFASSKAIADTDKLCSGGPYELGVLVNDEALAKLGFVFHDEDEPKRRVVQSQLEEGPSEERQARVFDLHPGRTSGYGLHSVFLLRRSAEHGCSSELFSQKLHSIEFNQKDFWSLV